MKKSKPKMLLPLTACILGLAQKAPKIKKAGPQFKPVTITRGSFGYESQRKKRLRLKGK